VLNPGEGPHVRGLYSVGGNYAVQGSDMSKSRRALGVSEFTVCHDPFFTETCRWADVVFPTTTFLERRDVLTSHSNYLFYSERACEPIPGVRNDYEIFAALARRLGFEDEFTGGRSADEWLDACIAESEVEDVEQFVSTGIYAGEDQYRVGLADFVEDPAFHPLPTPSGKIELHSVSFERAGGSAVPAAWENRPEEEHPLRMVTPHAPARVNSQFHDTGELERLNDDRIWINPEDAGRRGIEEDCPVVVANSKGRMHGIARVTRDILPGVVSCNQGVWPRFSPTGEELAGSVNVLTSTEPTLPSRGSRTHSVYVQIWKREEA
jgi:anaerobic dimethyl sulfoxide reductase subunit A